MNESSEVQSRVLTVHITLMLILNEGVSSRLGGVDVVDDDNALDWPVHLELPPQLRFGCVVVLVRRKRVSLDGERPTAARDTYDSRDEERFERIFGGVLQLCRVPHRDLALEFVGDLLGLLLPPALHPLLACLDASRRRRVFRILRREAIRRRLGQRSARTHLERGQVASHPEIASRLLLMWQFVWGRNEWQWVARSEQRQQIRRQILRHGFTLLYSQSNCKCFTSKWLK